MDGVRESRRGGRGGDVSLLLGVVTSIPLSGNRGPRSRVEGSITAIKTLGAAHPCHHPTACV